MNTDKAKGKANEHAGLAHVLAGHYRAGTGFRSRRCSTSATAAARPKRTLQRRLPVFAKMLGRAKPHMFTQINGLHWLGTLDSPGWGYIHGVL